MKAKVKVFAPVNLTEVQEKVEKAILNFFPVSLELREYTIPLIYGEGDIEDLRMLHLRLREEMILDTARRIFLNGIKGDTIRFSLNKQVAFVGKLNFTAADESLGSIDVEISADNEEELLTIIDWLAPQTEDGEIVMEIEF